MNAAKVFPSSTLPTVSVIIPTYNRARFIAETLESVFCQSYTNYEVIVVDDGSTDRTYQTLAPYLGRITCLRQEHQGPSAARNTGLAKARGEYIAFLDSDDLWEIEFLSATLQAFRQHPKARLATTNRRYVTVEGKVIKEFGKRSRGPFFTTENLLNEDWRTVGMPIVHRQSLLSVGAFDSSLVIGEDMNLWLRFSLRFPMVHVPRVLQNHRRHEENLGSNAMFFYKREIEALKKFAYEHPCVAVRKDSITLPFPRQTWKRWLDGLPLSSAAKATLWSLVVQPSYIKGMKRRIHDEYHQEGYRHLLAERQIEARECFCIAIRFRPLRFKDYLYWLFTYLPSRAYQMARNLKHKVLPWASRS